MIYKITSLSNGNINLLKKMPTQKTKPSFELYKNEKNYWNKNLLICGVDEVGRGCLAGPVVTSAAILHPSSYHPDLADSKTLSKKKLQSVYQWLIQNCTYKIGINSSRIIDKKNIYQATQTTMKQVIFHLLSATSHQPSLILIDAMPLNLANSPFFQVPCQSLIKGESQSASIAAASIIAKVTRDRIVQRLHNSFPSYKLDQHKGYGTQLHRSALLEKNASVIHRQSFLKNILKEI